MYGGMGYYGCVFGYRREAGNRPMAGCDVWSAPVCGFVGKGRTSLFSLSRGVACMGVRGILVVC